MVSINSKQQQLKQEYFKKKEKYLCKMMTVKTELRTWNENL